MKGERGKRRGPRAQPENPKIKRMERGERTCNREKERNLEGQENQMGGIPKSRKESVFQGVEGGGSARYSWEAKGAEQYRPPSCGHTRPANGTSESGYGGAGGR